MKKEFKKTREESRSFSKPSYLRTSFSSKALAAVNSYQTADDDDYFFEVEDY